MVWLPTDSQSSTVHESLRVTAGAVVGIARVSAEPARDGSTRGDRHSGCGGAA